MKTMPPPFPRGTIIRVAKRLDLSLSHVSRVAAGERESPTVLAALHKQAEKLAAKLGPPPAKRSA